MSYILSLLPPDLSISFCQSKPFHNYIFYFNCGSDTTVALFLLPPRHVPSIDVFLTKFALPTVTLLHCQTWRYADVALNDLEAARYGLELRRCS